MISSSALNLNVFIHFTYGEKQCVISSLMHTKPFQLQHMYRKVIDLYLNKFKYCCTIHSKTRDLFSKSFVDNVKITKKLINKLKIDLLE
jgi:hypothetical protein